MSTTSLTAGEVMDRSAALMNDPDLTDYTYEAQLPYLNMAIDELIEMMEESNNSPSNKTSDVIEIAVGEYQITPAESATTPHYPEDLVEIQEVRERLSGTTDPFVLMTRRESITEFPATSALVYWTWENQIIKFNPNGATTDRDIQLFYIAKNLTNAENENSIIGMINAKSFLTYKTAALCAQFIGENESRAALLDGKAEKAAERLMNLDNKGRQQMVTRRRPFRASYKARGMY